jgi:hypothetical protein
MLQHQYKKFSHIMDLGLVLCKKLEQNECGLIKFKDFYYKKNPI